MGNLDADPPPAARTVLPPWFWRSLVTGLLIALFVTIWVRWDQAAFNEWKQEAGPLPFFAALAVLPAFGVPTTPFYILAGATFGIAVALTGSAVSLSINLIICYWIARSGVRRWVAAALARTRYQLPETGDGRAIRFALLVKFTPGAPTFIKTYLIAIAGVPFWLFFVLSFVVTMAYATGFIVLGESILDHDYGQAGWALAVLAGVALAIWAGRRWWQRRDGGGEGASAP